jgi:hypothetical protein
MHPETKARLVAIAGRTYTAQGVTGVTGVAAEKAQEPERFSVVTRATPVTRPDSEAASHEPIWDGETRFAERAAIMEIDGGLPRQIAEALARLDTMPLPDGCAIAQWQEVIDRAARLADEWSARALALGWTARDLFGFDPTAGAQGLTFSLARDDRVISLSEGLAFIEGPDRARRSWCRRREIEVPKLDAA